MILATGSNMKAFTLLEMIVVLAIASLVIGIGAGAVQKLTEEHELLRVAHEAERVLMQAMTRTLTTVQPQSVDLSSLSQKAKLTVRHAGSETFVSPTSLRLRPGGLCEPLTLRWQNGANWVSATLDPLTAGFQEMEESP
jgi:prepilin-type N-terminal cleavage/methylation domain-containing protein